MTVSCLAGLLAVAVPTGAAVAGAALTAAVPGAIKPLAARRRKTVLRQRPKTMVHRLRDPAYETSCSGNVRSQGI